jgi:hypothetical protein
MLTHSEIAAGALKITTLSGGLNPHTPKEATFFEHFYCDSCIRASILRRIRRAGSGGLGVLRLSAQFTLSETPEKAMLAAKPPGPWGMPV